MLHVVEADDVDGFVVVEIWKDGHPTLEATGTCILRQILWGNVDIIGNAS